MSLILYPLLKYFINETHKYHKLLHTDILFYMQLSYYTQYISKYNIYISII